MNYINPFNSSRARDDIPDYLYPVSGMSDVRERLSQAVLDGQPRDWYSETEHRLVEMMRALKQVWPDVTFKHWTSMSKVWLCFPDELYPRGWVGWGNHDESEAAARFMVSSLAVEQWRYRESPYKRHVVLTTVKDKFVKLAKEFMQPITSQLVAVKADGNMRTQYRIVKRAKYNTVSNAFKAVTGVSDIGASYRGEVEPDIIKFINKLKEDIPLDKMNTEYTALFDSFADWSTTTKHERKYITLLWTDAQRIKVLELGVLGVNETALKQFAQGMGVLETTYPDFNALPEEYKGKVSMLHIAKEDTFVPNVGWRRGEVYCVQN